MDKVKLFVGQPVLSQILDTIPSAIINRANRKHNANRYYKRLPLRVHLVSGNPVCGSGSCYRSNGIWFAIPAYAASLSYFDTIRSAQMPSNLIQAQREIL